MTEAHAPRFHVTFWGTRGSIATPGSTTEKYGGNTPCVSVTYGKTRIIFDAGTGIRTLGIKLAAEMRANPDMTHHLLLSHTHWDHIQGFPFFEPAYAKGANLVVYGSPQRERFLESILRGQMDVNYFPVEMKAMSSNVTIQEVGAETITIGDVTIDIQEQVRHPGGSVRYRIAAGERRIVYATDVELDSIFACAEPDAETRTLADDYRAFIKDADLLVGDGQYTPEEYVDKHEWGHSTIPVLLRVAHEQHVRQLAVFHHDPNHSDSFIDRLALEYGQPYREARPPMNVFWAREGMTIEV
jgi:phosphoribosyl 1,2-cyclic phosphodiesterase